MSIKPRIEGAARQVIISSGIRAMGLLIATLLLGLVGLTLLTTVGAEAWRMVAAATPATAWRSPPCLPVAPCQRPVPPFDTLRTSNSGRLAMKG